MFAIQYTNDDGGRAVAMAMLPPPSTKPITFKIQYLEQEYHDHLHVLYYFAADFGAYA